MSARSQRKTGEEILSHIPDGRLSFTIRKYTRTTTTYNPTKWERFMDRWFT